MTTDPNQINYIFSEVRSLNDEENALLIELFKHPAVIKYFNLVARQCLVELALVPTSELTKPGYIEHVAFVKGTLSVVDTIMRNLPALPPTQKES